MPVHVHCSMPGCDAATDLPTSREVYGDSDPFDTPLPVAGETGWFAWAGRYFCPAHRHAPRYYADAIEAHTARRREAAAAWDEENPPPPVPGELWKPEKEPDRA